MPLYSKLYKGRKNLPHFNDVSGNIIVLRGLIGQFKLSLEVYLPSSGYLTENSKLSLDRFLRTYQVPRCYWHRYEFHLIMLFSMLGVFCLRLTSFEFPVLLYSGFTAGSW
jgi:hypothetical protein